jgi:hypothetical protein
MPPNIMTIITYMINLFLKLLKGYFCLFYAPPPTIGMFSSLNQFKILVKLDNVSYTWTRPYLCDINAYNCVTNLCPSMLCVLDFIH